MYCVQVGDGTTSVVLLACEFLKAAKPFIEDGVHPQIIIRGYRKACKFATDAIRAMCVHVPQDDSTTTEDGFTKSQLLERCAGTALNSKLICGQKALFAPMAVDAVMKIDQDLLDMKMIGTKKVPGGSVTDSFLVEGVAFKKTFSYAGFEQQPKQFENPLVVLLNVELELKNEKENAEIRLDDVKQYQAIVDAEWKIIYDKLDKIAASGAKVVLSKLPIGDLATQYFADRDIFCAGRVPDDDMMRVARATGAVMQTSLNDISPNVLGQCAKFEERQIGDERFNFITGCVGAKACSIILRGTDVNFLYF
jgi:T-complex protein 1 subunit eta